MRQTQGTIRSDSPDWQPWVIYFLRALKQQKRRLESKIERERIFLGKLPELSLRVLELVTDHGRVTNAQLVEWTDANRIVSRSATAFSLPVRRGYTMFLCRFRVA